MLLTITNTNWPATDLGYLLHKNPARVQSFALSFGQAHVFYPEASAERCTAALLLDVDPVGLVRNRRGPAGGGGNFLQASQISTELAAGVGEGLAVTEVNLNRRSVAQPGSPSRRR